MIKKKVVQYFIIADKEEVIVHITESTSTEVINSFVQLCFDRQTILFKCIGVGNHEGNIALTLSKPEQEKRSFSEIQKTLMSIDSVEVSIMI